MFLLCLIVDLIAWRLNHSRQPRRIGIRIIQSSDQGRYCFLQQKQRGQVWNVCFFFICLNFFKVENRKLKALATKEHAICKKIFKTCLPTNQPFFCCGSFGCEIFCTAWCSEIFVWVHPDAETIKSGWKPLAALRRKSKNSWEQTGKDTKICKSWPTLKSFSHFGRVLGLVWLMAYEPWCSTAPKALTALQGKGAMGNDWMIPASLQFLQIDLNTKQSTQKNKHNFSVPIRCTDLCLECLDPFSHVLKQKVF